MRWLSDDVCAAPHSVFSTRSVIWITSAEQWPNANIPLHFSIPDLSTCFIPVQLGSVLFRSVAHRGLRREGNHGGGGVGVGVGGGGFGVCWGVFVGQSQAAFGVLL